MNLQIKRERLLTSTMIAGLALAGFAAPALAQTAPATQADQPSQVSDIVVTGSRLRQPNLTTTSPVTQVTGEDIDVQGVTRVEDLVSQLPQAFAAQNSTVANGASGTATVSLRNLGSSRTLVLIDGKRMGYGSPQDDAADLNQIPGQMVERVEVLTGGASAVYGSDAVAGVVNFIMRRNFEGIEIDAQYGFYQHNNDYDGVGNVRKVLADRAAGNPSQYVMPDDNVYTGFSRELNILMGVNAPDDRGNITLYAGYRKNNKVLGRDYDYAACSLSAPTTAAPNDFQCGGSPTSYPGRFSDYNTNKVEVDGEDVNPMPSFDFTIGGDGFRNYGPNDAYNFGPLNYYQRPDERYTLGAFGHYQVHDKIEVYTQLMFSDYSTVAQIAPSGNFNGEFKGGFRTTDGSSFINCDNPLLSSVQAAAIGCGAAAQTAYNTWVIENADGTLSMSTEGATTPGAKPGEINEAYRLLDDPNYVPMFIGRRNVEGGGRQSDMRYEAYRGVLGARGDLNDAWSYDLSIQYSRSQFTNIYRNEFSNTRLARALDVVADPSTGQPVCSSVLAGIDADCVPYDIFKEGGVTQEVLNYLQVPLVATGWTTQQIVTGSMTADLGAYGVKTPWATRGVQAAFGAEYRRDALDLTPDVSFTSGDGAGQGGATLGLNGANQVYDVFVEAQVPIAEGMAFADQLSVDLAYRHSEYDLGGGTDSWKIGADWAPVPSVRFRASLQRAVRAPNVIELFTAQGFNLFDMDNDPCDDLNDDDEINGSVPAACIGTNPWQVSQTQSEGGALDNPSGQYNFLQGGSADLKPEESDTMTLGVVFTPEFLPGFNLTLDYFKIEVEDLISTIGPQNSLDACYTAGLQAACDNIQRNANGQLWIGSGNVRNLNTNIGGLKTSGVDVAANYNVDLADFGWDRAGTLGFAMVGTWIEKLETDTGLGFANSVYDCAGFYANQCGVPNPEWRHRLRVDWGTPIEGLNINGTWRYYGPAEVAVLGADGSLNNAAAGRLDRELDAQNYFDLAGTWQMRDNISVRAGVNNVFDSDPPLSYSVGTTGNNNTYPQLYNAMGRYFFFGVTANF